MQTHEQVEEFHVGKSAGHFLEAIHLHMQRVGSHIGLAALHIDSSFLHSQAHFPGFHVGKLAGQLIGVHSPGMLFCSTRFKLSSYLTNATPV